MDAETRIAMTRFTTGHRIYVPTELGAAKRLTVGAIDRDWCELTSTGDPPCVAMADRPWRIGPGRRFTMAPESIRIAFGLMPGTHLAFLIRPRPPGHDILMISADRLCSAVVAGRPADPLTAPGYVSPWV